MAMAMVRVMMSAMVHWDGWSRWQIGMIATDGRFGSQHLNVYATIKMEDGDQEH